MSSVAATDHYASQRDPQPGTETRLVIPRDVFDTLRQHGEETYPQECCGILLGTASAEAVTVHSATRAGNTRLDSARNRYHIEPISLLKAQREGRAQGLDIVGFYHSHPDHPAFWSETDFAEAHWYGCAYVITSVDGSGDAPRADLTNSFLLTGKDEADKAFARQPVVVS